MARKLVLICIVLFLLLPANSQFDELFFRGFKHAEQSISLNGGAKIEHNGIIRLTNDTLRVIGHAFYSKPIQFKNSADGEAFSFSTAFAFAIVPEYPTLGGHGFAFTISPSKELNQTLPSQYLGLLNASNVGNFSNHLFAVEFDTVQDFEFGDIDDNHVGVDINSLESKKSVPAAYFDDSSRKEGLVLKSGNIIQAWIDYDSGNHHLTVRLSPYSAKPIMSILSYNLDLSRIIKENMYVGFSSSTGLLASTHYILGWSFKMGGEAQSLDLSHLPSLPASAKSGKALFLAISLAALLFTILAIAAAFYIIRKVKNADVIEEWELHVGPHRYSYKELKQATKGFKDKQLLGFGGFGKVYKGTLPNSKTQVAVKRISHESKQGLREFLSEIESMGRLRHKNLVRLLGWCRKRGELLIVYDYMSNGSLDKYLFGQPTKVLPWEKRFKIIKDVASGLLYLHEEWDQTVIHRDIKSGNVLLDSEMNGRLGDFGLAKLYDPGSNPATTKVVGTLGYLAPELTRTGKPTASSDVFAFGALLLEVVCGRRPVEAKALPEELILVEWVYDKWSDGKILEVVDKKLKGLFKEFEVILVLKLGMMCSYNEPEKRPTMRQVVRYLNGEALAPDEIESPYQKSNSDFENDAQSYRVLSYIERGSTDSSAGYDIEVGVEASLNSLDYFDRSTSHRITSAPS